MPRVEYDPPASDDAQETYKRNCADARRILCLLDSRLAAYHETRGHALDLSRVTGGSSGRSQPDLDPVAKWCLSVAWALNANGPAVRHLLHARLTRRTKSAECSWPQLARELNDTAKHVEDVFKIMLPLFLIELERRGVGVNVRAEQEALPSHQAIRCAAIEHGLMCPA